LTQINQISRRAQSAHPLTHIKARPASARYGLFMPNISLPARPSAPATTFPLAIEPAAPESTVSRSLLREDNARVTLFSFAAGQELTPHTNRRRALVQILSGACDFFYNDTWQRLEAGTLLHLPPDHLHAVRAPEPFTMLLILCAE